MNIFGMFRRESPDEKLKRIGDRMESLKWRKDHDFLGPKERKQIDAEIAKLERESGEIVAKMDKNSNSPT